MRKYNLKPCPFCGGERVKFDRPWVSEITLIYCPDCTAVVSFGDNKRDSLAYSERAWNRREGAITVNNFGNGEQIKNDGHITINL